MYDAMTTAFVEQQRAVRLQHRVEAARAQIGVVKQEPLTVLDSLDGRRVVPLEAPGRVGARGRRWHPTCRP